MLIKQARDHAAQMAEVNDLLRQASPDWDAVTSTVGRVNDTVTSTTPNEHP